MDEEAPKPTPGKFKVKKTTPLHVVASNMADDIITAIFSASSFKTLYGLESGDDLDDVVDQALERTGMSEEQQRLSRTRLEMKFCLDISSSMWQTNHGRPILPGTVMMRMFNIALNLVRMKLPENVFKFSQWLWSAGHGGHMVCCLDDLSLGNFVPDELQHIVKAKRNPTPAEIDALYARLGAHTPDYVGHGTTIVNLLKGLNAWEQKHGDSKAHRLDLVVTDGVIDDWKKAGAIQVDRRNAGKYEGDILQAATKLNANIPEGFVVRKLSPEKLDFVTRDVLLEFVQRVF
jgi:hypothetical protein